MKTKLMFSVVATILVISVGAYMFISRTATPTPTGLQEVVSKVNAANTPTSMQGWKIYQSKNLPLTCTYPPNRILQDVPHEVRIYADTAENRSYIEHPGNQEGSRPGMIITALSSSQGPEDYAKAAFHGQEYATAILFGHSAVVLAGQGMDAWDVILFEHSGSLYEVTIQYGTSDDSARTDYYKILSSFSFTV